jgi:threonine dehydrogenase-like Zn-dependent dehydrogenase
MRALHWNGSELRLESAYPPPASSPDRRSSTKAPQATALVKVHLAGVCSTDLQILKGYMGFTGVPGHEFVGSVIDGPSGLKGRRVVGEINFGCGDCDYCARGLTRHCANRSVMGILNADGAFAEYIALPTENLHAVPDNLSDEEAVFTEPLAAAFEILTQIQINPGDEVLVLGDGKLGNLCAQVLRLTGAKITALGKHEDKLALIKKSGVRVVPLSDWQPKQFDIVVEATGSASGLELALGAVRPRGTLILKSTIAGKYEVSLAPIVINEINVIGSRCGPFADALDALAAHRVAVTPLIEKIYPLTDGIEALRQATRSGAKKILLRP